MKVQTHSSSLKPFPTSVLVRVRALGVEQVNGIIVSLGPKSVLDRPTYGIVEKVGEDVSEVKVGDEVHWDLENGVDFKFDDGNFVLIKEQNILCVVER